MKKDMILVLSFLFTVISFSYSQDAGQVTKVGRLNVDINAGTKEGL